MGHRTSVPVVTLTQQSAARHFAAAGLGCEIALLLHSDTTEWLLLLLLSSAAVVVATAAPVAAAAAADSRQCFTQESHLAHTQILGKAEPLNLVLGT
mgnify:CR=1 FL=1